MNKIYDNGTLMLGNVQDLIMEIEREMQEDNIDMEDILKELRKLRDIDYEMIVCINYENYDYQGCSFDYWSSKDIVKGGI